MPDTWRWAVAATLLVAFWGLASPARAGEAPRPDDRARRTAEILYEEGDIRGALLLTVKLLREAGEEDLRNWARERLQQWGLTQPEVLRVDPATQKPEELDALAARLAALREASLLRTLELQHARERLDLAVCIRFTAAGQAQVEVQGKDLAGALKRIVEIALDPQSGHPGEEALGFLEGLSITGSKVDAARKTTGEALLPPDLQAEVAAAVCLHQLREYREWVTNDGLEEEEMLRRAIGRRLGLALYQYCQKNFAETASFKREHETTEYWSLLSKAPPPPAEKF